MDPSFTGMPWGMALPLGIGAILMQNMAARNYYDSLNDEEKKEFIERTRSYRTEDELNTFLDSLLVPGVGAGR